MMWRRPVFDSAVFVLVALCAFAVVTCYRIGSSHAPPAATRTVTSMCRRCGAEFWSETGSQQRPIDLIDGCPNCPLTDEEFADLQRTIQRGPSA